MKVDDIEVSSNVAAFITASLALGMAILSGDRAVINVSRFFLQETGLKLTDVDVNSVAAIGDKFGDTI